jgi:hypothetical protein
MDCHRGAFNLTPADCTPGTPPVHCIPFDRSPDTTLFMDLGSTGPFINHHEKFLGKKRTELLLYIVWSKGDHVIAENFVSKIIGNNSIYRDLFEKISDKKVRGFCGARS